MKSLIRPAVSLFVALTLITGVVYPWVVTAIGQGVFPEQSSGSLVSRNGQVIGSELIGQSFTSPGYFWGRPSATAPQPYNASASSGSNLGPLNPALATSVEGRIQALKQANPEQTTQDVPVDLVTASGSGLDPHISPEAAQYQVPRVARARHLEPDRLMDLIQKNTEGRQWGLFGEARVNVLKLNLALDELMHTGAGSAH